MNTVLQPPPTTTRNTLPQQQAIEKYIQDTIEQRLNSCLMYVVQCITCEEAGILLSVKEDTVRDWIHSGKLAASKVGREWMIRVIDVDKMLHQNTNIIRIDDKRFRTNRRKIV